MQKGIILLGVVAFLMLTIACNDPIAICNVNVLPRYSDGKISVEFSTSSKADSIRVIDTSYMIAGSRGSGMSITGKEGFTWSFNRTFLLPEDSSRFLIPAVEIYNEGTLLCVSVPTWIDLGKIQEEFFGTQLREKKPFAWDATDSIPFIDARYSKQVALGDTLSLTLESNFPLDDVVAGFTMDGFAIQNSRYQTSQVKVSNLGERKRTFSQVMMFEAIEIGSFESEALNVELAGKTIPIPIVRIEVVTNKRWGVYQ